MGCSLSQPVSEGSVPVQADADNKSLPVAGGGEEPLAKPKEVDPEAARKEEAAMLKDKKEGDFEIIKVLGEGASCQVSMVREKQSGKHYAMKKVPNEFKLWDAEVKILKVVEHPKILEYKHHWNTGTDYYLLTSLYTGGELFDRIIAQCQSSQGNFTEKDAANLCQQMLVGLCFAHTKDLAHRDLKPENFVFEAAEGEPGANNMRMIDFGCAMKLKEDDFTEDIAGTPYYMAPEVIFGTRVHRNLIKKYEAKRSNNLKAPKVTKNNFHLDDVMIKRYGAAKTGRPGWMWRASDTWSIGVMCHLLVCGQVPFNGSNEMEILARVLEGRWSLPGNNNYSDALKDFLSKCLEYDPSKRITSTEALVHPWVTGERASTEILKGMMDNLIEFNEHNKLRKAVAQALAQRMAPNDKEVFQKLFNKFDKNGDGRLSNDEIADMMNSINQPNRDTSKAEDVQLQQIMENMDANGDGTVTEGEFVQASAAAEQANNLQEQFDLFDTDGDGMISNQEVLAMCDGFMTPDKVAELMEEADPNGDGKIDMNEWIMALGISNQKPGTSV